MPNHVVSTRAIRVFLREEPSWFGVFSRRLSEDNVADPFGAILADVARDGAIRFQWDDGLKKVEAALSTLRVPVERGKGYLWCVVESGKSSEILLATALCGKGLIVAGIADDPARLATDSVPLSMVDGLACFVVLEMYDNTMLIEPRERTEEVVLDALARVATNKGIAVKAM